MGKYKDYKDKEEVQAQEVEIKVEEMSVEEARKIRASMHKASDVVLTEQQKREAFRIFWAQEKSQYAMSADLEEVIWLHLKAMKMDVLEKFTDGIKHFGLTKIS